MVLLKSMLNHLLGAIHLYLHSTMVLLKSGKTFKFTKLTNRSTFHYGSIKI